MEQLKLHSSSCAGQQRRRLQNLVAVCMFLLVGTTELQLFFFVEKLSVRFFIFFPPPRL